MSNRKAHRREHSFHRYECYVQHRLRRPARSERRVRRIEAQHERRSIRKLIQQWTSALEASA